MKDKVLRRKGRGFGANEKREQDKARTYETVDSGEYADETGPQKCMIFRNSPVKDFLLN